MDYIDYYKILEIDKSASEADVKKAYRRLARKYHPDLNPNDTSAKKKFQQINEANEVLSDPEKRKKYDQYGKDWQHAEQFEQARQQRQQAGQGAGQGGYEFEFGDGGGFSDFFESMFGGGGGFRGGRTSQVKFKGQDIQAEMQLTLHDVYKTHQRTFSVGGKNIRITIPAGIENGQTIRIKGHGGSGVNGGPAGDLYLTFHLVNDTPFRREGNDLHTTHELDLYTAILGGETVVDTFDGKVKLKVPPETQSGTRVKLKGKGFPLYKHEGNHGDLYITWQVNVPRGLNEKEKELFRQLAALRHGK
jgi:curved DNA-binding protein